GTRSRKSSCRWRFTAASPPPWSPSAAPRKCFQRSEGQMKTVAFVGLGQMGGPMSANLEKKGFSIKTYDSTKTGNCASIKDAVKDADALITMPPDGNVVREVVLEALPYLRKDAIVVDMSSSEPAASRATGTALKARGIEMLDAPVSGAVIKAKDGTLAIMVGG